MDPTSASEREFATFGPWIDEVTQPQDVPPLFRDHPLDLATARLVLKVPRSIVRRDAHAGMDLYDHLLVLTAEQLTVLSRDTWADRRPRQVPGPGTYQTRTIGLHAIAAVRDSVSLLAGTLTILGRDGVEVTVGYNGSAREAVTRLVVELVASLSPVAPRSVGLALVAPSLTFRAASEDLVLPQDAALVSTLRDVGRERPSLVPLAWHGRQVLRAEGAGPASLVRRVLDTVSPTTLQGAILATDSRTLEVVGRHEWLVRGAGPVHSTSHLVITLDAIEGVDLAPHPDYPAAIVATLDLGAGAVVVIVPRDSDAHRILWQASEAGGA